MNQEMHHKPTKNKHTFPIWFLVLFPLALVFTISSIALYAYQQQQGTPTISVVSAQLKIQKQQILQQKDLIDTHWLHTLNPLVKEVRGRLLWSSNKQQGMMEFSHLPVLDDNQQYLLFIYDLNSISNKPIPAIIANNHNLNNSSDTLLIPFTSNTIIKNPFKFELLLKEKGVKDMQPLLLAQP